MELLGWKVGGLRLPLVEPSEEHIALHLKQDGLEDLILLAAMTATVKEL